MVVLVSHDTFRGLVQQAEWTVPAYKPGCSPRWPSN